jgi:hypothetical protein
MSSVIKKQKIVNTTSIKSYLDNITTNNVVLMILTMNSFPQVFRFPKSLLTEDMAKVLYQAHGSIIGEDSIKELNEDLLLTLEQQLEENLEYCLHTTEEIDGLPFPFLYNPLVFNKPVTMFSYAYVDVSRDESSSESSSELNTNIDALEMDITHLTDDDTTN